MKTDHERSCEKLLSAVIAQAIRDAAAPIKPTEMVVANNLAEPAIKAIEWLHGSVCEHYASLVGIDQEAMLDGLRRGQWKSEISKGGSGKKRKTEDIAPIVKQRLEWYRESVKRGDAYEAASAVRV